MYLGDTDERGRLLPVHLRGKSSLSLPDGSDNALTADGRTFGFDAVKTACAVRSPRNRPSRRASTSSFWLASRPTRVVCGGSSVIEVGVSACAPTQMPARQRAMSPAVKFVMMGPMECRSDLRDRGQIPRVGFFETFDRALRLAMDSIPACGDFLQEFPDRARGVFHDGKEAGCRDSEAPESGRCPSAL